MNKHVSNLRTYLAIIILLITLIAFVLITLLVFIAGSWLTEESGFLLGVIISGIAFCVLVPVLGLVFGKRILRPVRELSQATKEVAKGNFDVRLETENDDSEIGQLVVNFNTMVDELGSIEALRSDFISNVSHEFKTPLASMQGYATLLQDEELTQAERREYSQMIVDDARQLSELTSNILFLSKIENQGIAVEKAPFRLDESLRRAVLMLQPKWETKGIEVVPELETVHYTGSESMLTQAWTNLLDNAIKFTEPGGSVTIDLHTDFDSAQVVISDTGCGMDKETLGHIFEKFYQGNTSHSSEGNGLGLAMVQRIVALEGGQIHAESTPGIGTSFTVTLPLNGETDEGPTHRFRFRRRA